MTEQKERDIKDLVIKLNDRNIQRQRESGFTAYAIIAGIVYIIFYLINNIAFVIQEPALFLTKLIIITFTINTLILLEILYFVISSPLTTLKYTEILPEETIYDKYTQSISFLALGIGMLLANSFICQQLIIQKNNYWWYFAAVSIWFLLNAFITPLVVTIKGFFKNKQRKQLNFTYFPPQVRFGIKIGAVIFYGGALFTDFFVISNFSWSVEFLIAIIFIKFGIYLFGLYLLIQLFLDNKAKLAKFEGLEELEKRIYLEKLSDEQIVEILENNYFGLALDKWIAKRKIEINKFYEIREDQTQKLEQNLRDAEQIDYHAYKIEIKGRIDNLYSTIIDEDIENIQFLHEFSNHLKELLNWGSLNEQEKNDLQNLSQYYLDRNKKYLDNYLEVQNEIKVLVEKTNQVTS